MPIVHTQVYCSLQFTSVHLRYKNRTLWSLFVMDWKAFLTLNNKRMLYSTKIQRNNKHMSQIRFERTWLDMLIMLTLSLQNFLTDFSVKVQNFSYLFFLNSRLQICIYIDG